LGSRNGWIWSRRCCDISLSWWCSCSSDGIDWCYLLRKWLCIWLLA
jgi:hypothetical protein